MHVKCNSYSQIIGHVLNYNKSQTHLCTSTALSFTQHAVLSFKTSLTIDAEQLISQQNSRDPDHVIVSSVYLQYL